MKRDLMAKISKQVTQKKNLKQKTGYYPPKGAEAPSGGAREAPSAGGRNQEEAGPLQVDTGNSKSYKTTRCFKTLHEIS